MFTSIHKQIKTYSIFLIFFLVLCSNNQIFSQDIEVPDIQVQQLDLNNYPTPIQFSEVGMLILYYRLFAAHYVTIGVQNMNTGQFTFVAENFYFAHIAALAGIEQIMAFRFNLALLGAILGVPFNPEHVLRFYIHYSTSPMDNPTDYPFYQFDRQIQYNEDDADNSDEDPTDPTEPAITDTPPGIFNTNIVQSYYYGCQVPNIDLDDNAHPDTDEYAGDKNACGPAAASNSLKWLSDLPDNGVDIPIPHRDLLELLSGFMQRERNKGVSIQKFIQGKLDLIAELGLNINVKFQSESVADNINSTLNNSFARNDNGGSNYPTWDWLKQQMNDGEDVEIMYKWPDGEGGWRGHVVTLTGLFETADGKKGMTFKHDKKQKSTNGSSVVQEGAKIQVDSHGRMILHANGRTRYIAHAVAESPGEPFTPVELSYFTANIYENGVRLKWRTITETNNYGFNIFRNSEVIGFVEGKGTTATEQNYSFNDEFIISGKHKYELEQIDYDGSKEIVAQIELDLNNDMEFELFQNYPNPFNPSTNIKFSLPKGEYVTLKIFNTIGEEIITLIDSYMDSGFYNIEFDPSVQKIISANGVYIYRLTAGEFISTKKMVLMQ